MGFASCDLGPYVQRTVGKVICDNEMFGKLLNCNNTSYLTHLLYTCDYTIQCPSKMSQDGLHIYGANTEIDGMHSCAAVLTMALMQE